MHYESLLRIAEGITMRRKVGVCAVQMQILPPKHFPPVLCWAWIWALREGGLSVYSDREQGSNPGYLGERGGGQHLKDFRKGSEMGRRVRKKLKRGGCMKINVYASARSLSVYLCCMIKNFFKNKIK